MPRKKKTFLGSYFKGKLEEYGIKVPARLGFQEYNIAVNLCVLEQLQEIAGLLRTRLPKEAQESMLDVS